MSTYVVGRDLAGDDDEAGVDERLAGDAAVRVVAQDGVEDAVGDLVGDLVRVALGHGLGREEELVVGKRGHGLGVGSAVDGRSMRQEYRGAQARQTGARAAVRPPARPGGGRLRALAAALLALDEVDDQRDAVHAVALAQAVLDEVGVVARDARGAS